MTDSSSRTSGNQAPSIAAIRAANASLLGKSHPASKAFERDSYATATKDLEQACIRIQRFASSLS